MHQNCYGMHTLPQLFYASGKVHLPAYIIYHEWIHFHRLQVQVTTQTLVQLSTSQKQQMSDWCSAVYTARVVGGSSPFQPSAWRKSNDMTVEWEKHQQKERVNWIFYLPSTRLACIHLPIHIYVHSMNIKVGQNDYRNCNKS